MQSEVKLSMTIHFRHIIYILTKDTKILIINMLILVSLS